MVLEGRLWRSRSGTSSEFTLGGSVVAVLDGRLCCKTSSRCRLCCCPSARCSTCLTSSSRPTPAPGAALRPAAAASAAATPLAALARFSSERVRIASAFTTGAGGVGGGAFQVAAQLLQASGERTSMATRPSAFRSLKQVWRSPRGTTLQGVVAPTAGLGAPRATTGRDATGAEAAASAGAGNGAETAELPSGGAGAETAELPSGVTRGEPGGVSGTGNGCPKAGGLKFGRKRHSRPASMSVVTTSTGTGTARRPPLPADIPPARAAMLPLLLRSGGGEAYKLLPWDDGRETSAATPNTRRRISAAVATLQPPPRWRGAAVEAVATGDVPGSNAGTDAAAAGEATALPRRGAGGLPPPHKPPGGWACNDARGRVGGRAGGDRLEHGRCQRLLNSEERRWPSLLISNPWP